MLHLAWIVPLTVLIVFLASPRYRGDIAEARVRRILAQGLSRRRFAILNDIVVPYGRGTIAIDHVAVSKYGIFVIESHYARGLVSGTEVQDRWKQYHLGRNVRFDNPVYRNRLQAQALQTLLDCPELAFHRIVVMVGQRGFKTDMPANVVVPEKLISYIHSEGEQLLNGEQVARALQGIQAARVHEGRGLFSNRIALFRLLLLLVLLGGLYLAFGETVRTALEAWSQRG